MAGIRGLRSSRAWKMTLEAPLNLIEMLRKLLEYDNLKESPDYSTVLEQLDLPDDEDPEILRQSLEDELEALEAREGSGDSDEESDVTDAVE
jgi:hypothetical protein